MSEKKRDVVQVKNPRTQRYVKVDRDAGRLLSHKATPGPYKGVPVARRRRTEVTEPPALLKPNGRRLTIRTLLPVLLLLAATGAAGQAPIPDSAIVNRVAGCYILVPGPWQSDTAIRGIRAIPSSPIRFELRREIIAGQGPDAQHRAISDSLPGYPHGLYSIWARISGTSNLIRIGQPFLYADFALRLSPSGADLVGDFVAYGLGTADLVSSARAPVTARRMACETGVRRYDQL